VALGALFAGTLGVPVAGASPAAPGLERAVAASDTGADRAADERPDLSRLPGGPSTDRPRVELKAGPDRGRSLVTAPVLTGPSQPGRSSVTGLPVTANIQVNYRGFTPQAQLAFQSAVDIVKTLITTPVPIRIDADFAPLGYGVLGSAGPGHAWGFVDNTGYEVVVPGALANDMDNLDIDSTEGFSWTGDSCKPTPAGATVTGCPEVAASFNSDFNAWYYGTDGKPPVGQWDFKSVVLHEIWHGLGFAGGMYVDGGVGKWQFGAAPAVYDLFTSNTSNRPLLELPSGSLELRTQLEGGKLQFVGPDTQRGSGGPAPRLYAPNPWEQGSSYSHLDEARYPAGDPNSLMTPQIGPGEAIHSPGPIALGMFSDMGWQARMVPVSPSGVSAASGAGSATIRWTAPVDNGGTPVTHYQVTPSPGATVRVNAPTTSVTFPGLTPGATYRFTVKAFNGIGASPASAPVEVTVQAGDTATPVETKYASLGGSLGFLGTPLAPEATVRDGRFTDYRSGSIYWRAQTGAHEVHGSISERWTSMGGVAGPLGFPATDELFTINGGRLNDFEGGSVYWTAGTGAREVYGAIRATWKRLGAERSGLGFPTTGEVGTPDRVGRFNHFEGGSVYWTPGTGAREVRGAIRDRWAGLGWERSALGYPRTDELPTPDGRGRFNHFQVGSVYWTAATGAREVRGAILDRWASLGWERSALGYPVTDELPTVVGGGRFNHFQHGSVYWSPATGAQEVRGAIRNQWGTLGWEAGRLGFPTSGEFDVPGGRRTNFQGGAVVWDARTGATRVLWN